MTTLTRWIREIEEKEVAFLAELIWKLDHIKKLWVVREKTVKCLLHFYDLYFFLKFK